MIYSLARPISTQSLAERSDTAELRRARRLHGIGAVRDHRSEESTEHRNVNRGASDTGTSDAGSRLSEHTAASAGLDKMAREIGKGSRIRPAERQANEVAAAAAGDTASPAWAGYNSLGVLVQVTAAIGSKVNNMV